MDNDARQQSFIEASLEHLLKQVGIECSIQKVSRLLCEFAERLQAPVVGAMHVTCSDELERTCFEAFQRGFVQHLVPSLRFGSQSAFRIANLGARYEPGSIAVAERHFTADKSIDRYKLMVVKINAHVGIVEEADGSLRYGAYARYGKESACCSALEKLLAGGEGEAFDAGGPDRLAILRDETKVALSIRSLAAAVVSTLMQARRAMADIRDHRSATPTLYVVAACVTLNRSDRDAEILCGIHVADHATIHRTESYYGLGHDPSHYAIKLKNQTIHIASEKTG